MITKTFRVLRAVACSATIAIGSSLYGIVIDSTELLGTVTPNPTNSPANEAAELSFINQLLSQYNASPKVVTVSSGGLLYRLQPGADVPAAPLPAPTSNLIPNTNLNFVSGNVNLGTGGSYLVAKVAENFGVYYIGGLTGSHTLTNNIFLNSNSQAQDFSHFAVFGPVVPGSNTPGIGVPDGGPTIALLGVGLLGLAALRRRLGGR